MKLIVITSPLFFAGEANAINMLFQEGLEILHLRKPQAPADSIQTLLNEISPIYHPRIVIHEHFDLLNHYNLKGIHLNSRNPNIPLGYQGHVSCSCHSIEEVNQRKPTCYYVFLSPIYNSISKSGYNAAFQLNDLHEAAQSGIIDEKVIALGGIDSTRLAEIKSIGFGGAALLGDIWQKQVEELPGYFQYLKQLIR